MACLVPSISWSDISTPPPPCLSPFIREPLRLCKYREAMLVVRAGAAGGLQQVRRVRQQMVGSACGIISVISCSEDGHDMSNIADATYHIKTLGRYVFQGTSPRVVANASHVFIFSLSLSQVARKATFGGIQFSCL